MSIVLASHQPDFFPYMGYFYKIFKSDVFVFSDNVQYSKSGRHDYNLIMTGNGPLKLKLPIHYHCENICDIQIAATQKDLDKILKTLKMEYGKYPHFSEVYPVLEKLFQSKTTTKLNTLASFNTYCLMQLCSLFGLTVGREFLTSSDLPLTEKRDKRIIQMCLLIGADTYVSGSGAKDYHIEQDYEDNGINLVYSDYTPVIYDNGIRPYMENLSVIDYLFSCGFDLPKEWTK